MISGKVVGDPHFKNYGHFHAIGTCTNWSAVFVDNVASYPTF